MSDAIHISDALRIALDDIIVELQAEIAEHEGQAADLRRSLEHVRAVRAVIDQKLAGRTASDR